MNALSSNCRCLFLFLILPLLCIRVASAQIPQQPAPPAADSLVERFSRTWPKLRLVYVDPKLAESLFIVQFGEEFDRLEAIAEAVTPSPLSHFASTAIAAVHSKHATSFAEFKAYICKRFPEYDCEYDFDHDDLERAYYLAKSIVEESRSLVPGQLFLLTTEADREGMIHAVLGFDSASGDFRVLTYTHPLDTEERTRLMDYLDSRILSFFPFPIPFQRELETLSVDSLRRWSAGTSAPRVDHGIVPHQVHGFEFLWLYTKEERRKELGPIVAHVGRIRYPGFWNEAGVDSIEVSCDAASAIGLAPPRIVRTGRLGWSLVLDIQDKELFEETIRKSAEMHLNVRLALIQRRSNPDYLRTGEGNVAVTIIPDYFFESK